MKCTLIVLTAALLVIPVAQTGQVSSVTEAMPVAQQGALVQKYCVGCHNEAKMMGGLSLEKFDPANPDPSVAGMMVSKLEGGAMSAAGLTPPDRVTTSALIAALAARAANAEAASGGWTLKSFNDPTTKVPLVTASMVRETASAAYELTITCRKTSDLTNNGIASHPPEIQLTGGRGSVPPLYEVDGSVLPDNPGAAKLVAPLPTRTFTIRNAVTGETVTFPFGGLTATVRHVLSTCLK